MHEYEGSIMQDGAIVDLYWQRNELAIEETDKKYGKFLFRIADNILFDREDSNECVNDTYLKAWNTMPPQKPDPLRTYIFRIARNISTAKYHANTAKKRNSYYDVALDELEECLTAPATVEQEVAAKELSLQIDRFLDTLDKESRVMFVRRYWYSDSIPELAERFETSKNSVSVRLSRTRDKLKHFLLKEGFEV